METMEDIGLYRVRWMMMAVKDSRMVECKKLGGRYNRETGVCEVSNSQFLWLWLLIGVVFLLGVVFVGGITLYTTSAVFNVGTFTWTGAVLVGVMIMMLAFLFKGGR